MTFPFPPRRSSSEDDALDQALNAWASGEQYQRHSEPVEESPREARRIIIDALEFHRWADDARRTDSAATGPAAETWNRVLRSTAQENPKGKKMSSATIRSQPQGFTQTHSETLGESIRRYSNLAATVAILLAVAVGGWFTMSQMAPGGNGRFAAVSGTPEMAQSQTCDVEPLTVDEVVAIVENPYSAVEQTWFATPPPNSDMPAENLVQAQEYLDLTFMQTMIVPSPSQAAYSVPEEATFEEASKAAQKYLTCVETGTYGQIWALTEPVMIQVSILAPHPIYRDEATIRGSIEERIDQVPPFPRSADSYTAANADLTITTNPRRGDARIWLTDSPEVLDYDKVVLIGMQALDGEGNIVFADDWNTTTVEGDASRSNGTSLILVHSESTDTWYFFHWHAPRG